VQVERSPPAARGVTWDPPSAPVQAGKPEAARRGSEEGYPATPSQARVPPPMPASSGPRSVDAFLDGALDDVLEDSGGPMLPCPHCDRSFKAESLEKHKNICKKVFQQKRKQFNSAANRLGEFENANELIANASKIERQKEAPKAAPEKGKKDKSVPKWKAQSLAFRQAILAAKGASGDPEAAKKADEIQQELNAANLASGGNVMESDMVKCPHCGRTFNKEAGARHIAICLKTFGNKLGRQTKAPGGGSRAAKPSTPTSASAAELPTRGAMVRGPSASRSKPSGQSGRRGSLSQAGGPPRGR